MDKFAKEIFNMNPDLYAVVKKEFNASFFIVGRDQDNLVVGNAVKSVRFDRATLRVKERYNQPEVSKLQRK